MSGSMLRLFQWCSLMTLLPVAPVNSWLWSASPIEKLVAAAGKTNDEVYKMRNDYCPLIPTGMFPYLVKIYADIKENKNSKHLYLKTGALLSHRAIITTCTGNNFFPPVSQIKVSAQRIWQVQPNNRKVYCYQTRNVLAKYNHPKCKPDKMEPEWINEHWDFGIYTISRRFFSETEYAYPVVTIPKDAYSLMMYIRKVTYLDNDIESCELPRFNTGWKYPIIAYTAKLNIRMRKDVCNVAICKARKKPLGECLVGLHEYMNHTYICAEAKFLKKFAKRDDRDLKVWNKLFEIKLRNYLGGPMICNSTSIGIATQEIDRDAWIDWWFITTYLRVWPWLMQMKDRFWDADYGRGGPDDSPILSDHVYERLIIPTQYIDKHVYAKEFPRFIFSTYPTNVRARSGENGHSDLITSHIFVVLIPIVQYL